MTTVYRTASLSAKSRFPFWQTLMCQNVALAHGSSDDDERFDARVSVSVLGAATVFDVSAPFQSWQRSREQVRRSPRNEYLMTMMLSGSGLLSQDGHEVVQRPGVMTIYDTDRPFSYELCGHTIFVKIPHQQLHARLPQPVQVATPISSETTLGAMAADLFRSAGELDVPKESSTGRLLGSSILDVIAALQCSVGAEKHIIDASRTAPLFERIKRYISENLGDTDLSVESIARAHRISPRTLNRAFATIGATPMRWVWQERLAASHRALLQGGVKRVTDVAFNYGFSELSHFSRVFKNEFGLSPHCLIAQASSGATQIGHAQRSLDVPDGLQVSAARGS